jgi:hypothetical protein
VTATLRCSEHPACFRLTFACHHPTPAAMDACAVCRKRMRALGVAP